jgi:Ca2+-binding EF-hand superfamily protein
MSFLANRRMILAGLASMTILAGMPFGPLWAAGNTALKGLDRDLDRDNDGTLDLNEVKSAAEAAFDKLDRDKDGTLDRKELGRRIGKEVFAEADADKDGTLTKDEYVGLAEKWFKEVDKDNEGTLDAKELRSKAGLQLLKLLK